MARTGPFDALGLRAVSHPYGEVLEADTTGRTAVPGVWAAGNVSDLVAQVGNAAADGARAAQHLNADLMATDLEEAVARVR